MTKIQIDIDTRLGLTEEVSVSGEKCLVRVCL